MGYKAREEIAKKMEEHNKLVIAQKNEIEKLNMEFNVLQNNIQASEGKTDKLDDVAKQYQLKLIKISSTLKLLMMNYLLELMELNLLLTLLLLLEKKEMQTTLSTTLTNSKEHN